MLLGFGFFCSNSYIFFPQHIFTFLKFKIVPVSASSLVLNTSLLAHKFLQHQNSWNWTLCLQFQKMHPQQKWISEVSILWAMRNTDLPFQIFQSLLAWSRMHTQENIWSTSPLHWLKVWDVSIEVIWCKVHCFNNGNYKYKQVDKYKPFVSKCFTIRLSYLPERSKVYLNWLSQYI